MEITKTSPRRRICVLYTGGTIGMIEGKNGIRRPPEDPADFLSVAPQAQQVAEIDFRPVLNKDSIDMTTGDWSAIAESIYERRNQGYSGFVVVHGVDTMAFGATAVALALGPNLNFPVVFVGGQTAVSLGFGDGQINLIRACHVALKQLAEVVICFNNKVYRAGRAQKKDDRDFDAFESPGFPPLCVIKDTIELHQVAVQCRLVAPDIELRAEFASGIVAIPMTPATPPDLLESVIESPACRCLVLQSFGGGNIPNKAWFSFVPLVEKACARGIPVIVTSLFPADPNEYLKYESGIVAKNAGAIQISGLVFPALVAKLSWVLPQVASIDDFRKRSIEVERLMKTPYVGEIDPTPGFEGNRE